MISFQEFRSVNREIFELKGKVLVCITKHIPTKNLKFRRPCLSANNNNRAFQQSLPFSSTGFFASRKKYEKLPISLEMANEYVLVQPFLLNKIN